MGERPASRQRSGDDVPRSGDRASDVPLPAGERPSADRAPRADGAGTEGEYFLRHQYDDPLVKDGKWGLLFAGPGGQIVDPNSDRVSYGEELGSVSTSETQTVGGLLSSGQGPQEIGGLPIAGVKTLSSDKPFRVYRGLSDYSQWQFTIYDLQNLQTPGQSAGQVRPGDPANRGRRPGSPAGGRAPRNLPGRSGGGGN